MKRSAADIRSTFKQAKLTLENNKLTDSYYDNPCINLAKSLLGKRLVRQSDGVRLACKIVEVESYLANDDRSSHSYKRKKTKRNEAMFMKPGTLYVYTTYGMYQCMNITSGGDGDAVLIRSAEPTEGIEKMLENRRHFSKSKNPIDVNKLCNGPSKLCQALDITMEQNKLDLSNNNDFWVEDFDHIGDEKIVCAKRIGLNEKRVGECASKPLRFYVVGNTYVSKRDKVAEEHLESK